MKRVLGASVQNPGHHHFIHMFAASFGEIVCTYTLQLFA